MNATKPQIRTWPYNIPSQRSPVTDSGNSFDASDLVRITSGALVKCSSDDLEVYGLTPDASHPSSGVEAYPPYTLFGENHYPFNVAGAGLVMSAVDSVNRFSTSAGVQYASWWLNMHFALITVSSGGVAYQCVDISDSNATDSGKYIVTINGLDPRNEDGSSERNPWVLCTIASRALQ